MNSAIFAAGLRTPFTRAFKGAYANVRPDDLVVQLISAHRDRYAEVWKTDWDDMYLGCAYPEGEQGYNLARMVALGAGLGLPGATVNRLCASSLEAASIAAARIRCGWGSAFLVGGVESMSRIPRRGGSFSESEQIKQACPVAYIPNGETAENVARQFALITRADQEDFAAASHNLSDQAWLNGKYDNQIHPYLTRRDEFIRVPVDLKKMASLTPAFAGDGVVTAATSSPLSDGATLGLVLERQIARQCGIKTGVEIVDAACAHVSPDVMGMGPVPATRKILERNGLQVRDIAAWEINEAFAIQVLASIKELDIPAERVNRWGGAIALGHPLGASGLRLLMTLHDRLVNEHDVDSWGIATLCVGGGQGMTVLVRRF